MKDTKKRARIFMIVSACFAVSSLGWLIASFDSEKSIHLPLVMSNVCLAIVFAIIALKKLKQAQNESESNSGNEETP